MGLLTDVLPLKSSDTQPKIYLQGSDITQNGGSHYLWGRKCWEAKLDDLNRGYRRARITTTEINYKGEGLTWLTLLTNGRVWITFGCGEAEQRIMYVHMLMLHQVGTAVGHAQAINALHIFPRSNRHPGSDNECRRAQKTRKPFDALGMIKRLSPHCRSRCLGFVGL